MFDTRDGREVNVTANPFRDSGGELTPDGRTLVFTSARDDGTNHLFAVSLPALTEDPDDPLVPQRASAAPVRTRRGARAGAAPVGLTVDAGGHRGPRRRSSPRGANAVGSVVPLRGTAG